MWNYILIGSAAAIGLLLAGNLFVFNAFLSDYTQSSGDDYVAVRLLSTPAQGGYHRFQATCAECHGSGGQGSANGPRLTGLNYARDFTQSEAFHSQIARNIPEHRALMGTKPNFNDMELMAKFLREMRQQLARREES